MLSDLEVGICRRVHLFPIRGLRSIGLEARQIRNSRDLLGSSSSPGIAPPVLRRHEVLQPLSGGDPHAEVRIGQLHEVTDASCRVAVRLL